MLITRTHLPTLVDLGSLPPSIISHPHPLGFWIPPPLPPCWNPSSLPPMLIPSILHIIYLSLHFHSSWFFLSWALASGFWLGRVDAECLNECVFPLSAQITSTRRSTDTASSTTATTRSTERGVPREDQHVSAPPSSSRCHPPLHHHHHHLPQHLLDSPHFRVMCPRTLLSLLLVIILSLPSTR